MSKHDWPMVSFKRVLQDVSAGHEKIPKSKFQVEGKFPVIDQSANFLAGYTDNEPSLLDPPYIVFGDHTRELKFVDFPFLPGADGVKALKVSEGFEPKYVYHFMKHCPVESLGYSRHFKLIKRMEFPFPPLDEQRSIAGILDHLNDALVNATKQLDLLNELQASSVQKVINDVKEVQPLSSVVTFHGGSTPSKKNPSYWGGGIPWFSTKDLKQPYLEDSVSHIAELALEETSLRPIPEPGIAVSVRGMSLSHRLPMSVIPAGSTVNQDLKVLIPNDPTDLTVVQNLLKSKEPYLLSKVSSSAHGTKKLDFKFLAELQIPVLGSEQRKALVEIVESSSRLRYRIMERISSVKELQKSLSTRAFQGEL